MEKWGIVRGSISWLSKGERVLWLAEKPASLSDDPGMHALGDRKEKGMLRAKIHLQAKRIAVVFTSVAWCLRKTTPWN